MSTPTTYTLEAGDGSTTYEMRFTALSAFIVQKETGLTLEDILTRIQSGKAGVFEISAILYGALEGQRIKARAGGLPWSIERVCNLADASGDMVDWFIGRADIASGVFIASMPKVIERTRKAAEAAAALKAAQEIEEGAEKLADPPAAVSTSTAT